MSWLRRLIGLPSRRARNGDPLPTETAPRTEEQALALAEAEAKRDALPWCEPVSAELRQDEGHARWMVRSNVKPDHDGFWVYICLQKEHREGGL